MKFVILLGLIAFAAAQQGSSLAHLIQTEVHAIVAASPGITAEQCTSKCDTEFALLVAQDETLSDQECRHACDRAIHARHTTAAPPN